jgi:hypothetical protein
MLTPRPALAARAADRTAEARQLFQQAIAVRRAMRAINNLGVLYSK